MPNLPKGMYVILITGFCISINRNRLYIEIIKINPKHKILIYIYTKAILPKEKNEAKIGSAESRGPTYTLEL